jgi:hypothetical protein
MIDSVFNTNVKVYAAEVDDSKVRAYQGFEENHNLDGIWAIFLWLNLILIVVLIFAFFVSFLKKT